MSDQSFIDKIDVSLAQYAKELELAKDALKVSSEKRDEFLALFRALMRDRIVPLLRQVCERPGVPASTKIESDKNDPTGDSVRLVILGSILQTHADSIRGKVEIHETYQQDRKPSVTWFLVEELSQERLEELIDAFVAKAVRCRSRVQVLMP